jgi:hypothetical protein
MVSVTISHIPDMLKFLNATHASHAKANKVTKTHSSQTETNVLTFTLFSHAENNVCTPPHTCSYA